MDGLFFIARAANLAQGAGKDQIAKFGKSKYTKYHGGEDGWSDLLALTATTTLPPRRFHHQAVRAADSGAAGSRSS